MPSWGVLCDDARRQFREHKTGAILKNFNAVDVQMKRAHVDGSEEAAEVRPSVRLRTPSQLATVMPQLQWTWSLCFSITELTNTRWTRAYLPTRLYFLGNVSPLPGGKSPTWGLPGLRRGQHVVQLEVASV